MRAPLTQGWRNRAQDGSAHGKTSRPPLARSALAGRGAMATAEAAGWANSLIVGRCRAVWRVMIRALTVYRQMSTNIALLVVMAAVLAGAPAAVAVSVDPLAQPLPSLPPDGVAAAQWGVAADPAQPQAEIEMFVGETRIFPAPDVARIAVGNSQVVHAAAADDKEVVVFARAPGSVSVVIWTHDGRSRNLLIQVVDQQALQTRQELAAFIARIPNARSQAVGDKLIVEGRDLSDADQARIADLAQRYPQIVDFTDRVGWDRMVLFDVQVVELPRNRMRELGVRWESSPGGGIQAGAVWDPGVGRGIEARPGEGGLAAAFPLGNAAGYLGFNLVWPARLQAMSRDGEAVLLAQPQLMARSGTSASFLAGGELPYTHVDANGRSSTLFKPYGVTLEVTPQIDPAGTVRATIDVEVSAVDPTVNTNSGPALRTRRTRTDFNLRSGQTLVLSGFLSRERVRETDAVPGLGRIPVLGALFRATRWEDKDVELVIFVTPVVVDNDNPELQARVAQSRQVLQEAFPRPAVLRGDGVPPADPFALPPLP